MKAEIRESKFEERDAEATRRVRSLEEKREEVSGELRRVSLLADERAKVDVKRGEVRGREGEMKSPLDLNDEFLTTVGRWTMTHRNGYKEQQNIQFYPNCSSIAKSFLCTRKRRTRAKHKRPDTSHYSRLFANGF